MDWDEFFRGIRRPDTWRVLEKWDEYMAMVERVEAMPENQSGADKTWVERAERSYRDHYDSVARER